MVGGRLVCLCLTGAIIALALWSRFAPPTDWLWRAFATLRFDGATWQSVGGLLGQCALRAAPFAAIGALSAAAVALFWRAIARSSAPGAGPLATLCIAGVAFGLAFFLVGIARGLGHGVMWLTPGPLASLGCLIGVCVGDVLVRPGRTVGPVLFGRGVWLTGVAGVALGLFLFGILSGRAATGPHAAISSAQKRALVAQLRSHNPLQVPERQTTTLALSVQELQALLSWAALLIDGDARVEVRAADGALSWRAAVALPAGFGRRAVLNLGGEFDGAVTFGALRAQRCDAHLGALRVGGWGCRVLLGALLSSAHNDRTFGSLLTAVNVVRIDGRGLRASYGRVTLDARMQQVLQRLIGPDPAVRAAVDAQVALLRVTAADRARERDHPEDRAGDRDQDRGDDRFARLLQGAFRLARARSAGGDPIAENQGAILALAAVFGHPHVATLAGLSVPPDSTWLARRQGELLLRQRDDWVKHFLVSAGLTQITTAVVSDAAGLLKEELDAGGGSGFSFGDLLADRAGTLFGETAVRSAASARALQDRIIDAWRVGDFMPEGGDLPEDLQDAAFTARFGGVGGAGYRAMVARIEARLLTCAAYRLP